MSDRTLQQKDAETWNAIHATLRKMLQDCAHKAVQLGQLSKGCETKYTISVTEEEINEGLLTTENAKQKALCYVRNIEGLTERLDQPVTEKFTDITQSKTLDDEAKALMNDLKNVKIPSKLDDNMDRFFNIDWKGEALESSEDKDYQQYLEVFCSRFTADMKQLVKEHSIGSEKRIHDDNGLYYEVLHHAKFASEKLRIFCGRKDELNAVKDALLVKTKTNEPLIIIGKSGYGKTSLLAKISSNIPKWIGKDTIMMLRFLGTSPQSSNILMVLRSIISHLCALFDYTLPSEDKLSKMGEVRRYLIQVFNRIGSSHADNKVVIILDSIDQLAQINGAHQMTWLPTQLPANIHIILSMLSDRYSCLTNIQKRLPNQDRYIALKPLSPDTGKEIIHVYLRAHHRQIISQQREHILQAFASNSQPLFLKLVLDVARKWYSYTTISDIHVSLSVEEGINVLFQEMESKYGQVFVERALGYMTCGKGGLTGIEMEDILSCDNDALNEVYKYHDPPLEGTIRIPSLLWARLQYELKEYLAERQVDNKTVMTWYHRQFWEVADQRYLSKRSDTVMLHRALAEMFGQENGIKKTIVLHQRKGKILENSDRRVAPQILSVTNLRKLNALTFHLLHADEVQGLKEQCAIKFDFLFAKLKAVGINELFNEFKEFSTHPQLKTDTELILLLDFIEISYAPLQFDPNLFAFYITERLEDYSTRFPLIGKMVDDAKLWLKEANIPMMLPLTPTNLTPVDSPLKFTLMVGYDGVLTRSEKAIVCNWNERKTGLCKVQVFDLETRDLLVSNTVKKNSPIAVTADSQYFFHVEVTNLTMVEVASGDQFGEWCLDDQYEVFTVRAMEVSFNGKYLAVIAKLGKPKNMETAKAFRSQTKLYLLDLENPEDPMKEATFFEKKHADKILFLENDECLMTISRERISVYSVPDMEKVQTCTGARGIHGTVSCYDLSSKTLVYGVELKVGARFSLYNYSSNETTVGPIVYKGEPSDDTVQPFGLAVQENLEVIVLGTTTTTDIRHANLWIWKKADPPDWTSYRKVQLGENIWKIPSVLKMSLDWKHCFIGWRNGDISLIDMEKEEEIYSESAHAHTLQGIHLVDKGATMVTVAGDHSLRIWDVDKFINQAHTHFTTIAKSQLEDTGAIVKLDLNTQVLTMTACSDFVITASEVNKNGPRFWSITNGEQSVAKTMDYEEKYQECLRNLNVPFEKRFHGTVDLVGDLLIYSRKRRNAVACFATALDNPTILGAEFFTDTYFQLVVPKLISTKCKVQCDQLMVKDGEFQCITFPSMEVVLSLKMPKITDDIPNILSANGKRLLLYYKLVITTDAKYAVLLNPAPSKQTSKGFDWFDLEHKKNLKRVPLPKFLPWNMLDDSIYFFVERENQDPGLFKPSMIPSEKDGKITYMCLLYGGNAIISDDLTLGLEFIPGNRIRVWKTETIERKATLSGHIAEVTCGHFSPDNRFLATGSYDCTVRLWDVTNEQQLCLYHAIGSIDRVMFTPSMKQLAIHHYSAPQRKRGAIMALRDLPS